MFDIVLVHPEIPPNAGNVIRLAANTGCRLHLVEPLGFSMDDKQLKRAGLDYHEMVNVAVHRNWGDCRAALSAQRLFALSTRGMGTGEMQRIGGWMLAGLKAAEDESLHKKIRGEVSELCKSFPAPTAVMN